MTAPPAGHGPGPKPGRDALIDALDRVDAPVTFFIRDDDAGWADDRLFALLDTTARAGVAIDLAVIPDACHDALAAELLRRTGTQRLGVHQHGFAHRNHQDSGRKCEFGNARSPWQRAADLATGRDRLGGFFGSTLDAIFTPPWNRCTDDTPGQLAALGFTALSRDSGAPAQTALPEIPIHVDWCRSWTRATSEGESPDRRMAAEMGRHVGHAPAIGLMLHHAVMADDELAALGRLLARWSAHPCARWLTMRELLPATGA